MKCFAPASAIGSGRSRRLGNAAAVALCLLGVARAEVYYVAATGSDSNPGTELGAPLRSLGAATAKLAAGDVLLIRGGTYRETLTPRRADCTIAAYGGETVVISALNLVKNWSPQSGAIYRADMGWDLGAGCNQVFVDGEFVPEARTPNVGTGGLLNPVLGPVTNSATAPTTLKSPNFKQADGVWANGWFVGRVDKRWAWQWGRIDGSTADGAIRVGWRSKPWFTGSGEGFLFGKLAALDAPNEWHYEAGKLCLRTGASDDPNRRTVEAKRRAWCVDFGAQRNVTIHGLRLFGGAVNMNGSGCVLENCSVTHPSHFTVFATWSGYDGAGGAGSGHQGIYIAGNDNVVRACAIAHSAGCGLLVAGRRNIVTRCDVRNTSYAGTYACPIRLTGTHAQILFNRAHDAGRDICVPTGAGHDIRYNDFSRPGALCRDAGVLYAYAVNAQDSDGARTRIAFNWIHDNPHSKPAPLIYLDNWCRNFDVHHNVCWQAGGDAGVRLNEPRDGHRVHNNTLFYCDNAGTHTYRRSFSNNNPNPAFWRSDKTYGTSIRNTLFLGKAPASQLTDWSTRDFTLKPGAAAIDAGVALKGFTDDYRGAQPDLGAYEFGGFAWTAGTEGSSGRPGLSAIESRTLVGPVTFAFVVSSSASAQAGLTLTGSSSNPSLIPNANILFGGRTSGRTVTLIPAPGRSGAATIGVRVHDGALSVQQAFTATVAQPERGE